MKKLIVLYGPPADPSHFDRYFHQTHVPLVLKMPHLVAFEVSKGPIVGGEYHLLAQLTYRTQADLDASLASPEGQAVVADVPNYATGTVEMLTIESQVLS